MKFGKVVIALVVAIIVVAAIVRPAPSSAINSYFSAMKAGLRTLATAQEEFFADSSRFARTIEELGDSFWVSSGVNLTITQVSDSLFKAVARHDYLEPPGSCEIVSGIETTAGDIPDNGVPSCKLDVARRKWIFIWER